MDWLTRFEITAAVWLVIPFAGVSGAERGLPSDRQSKLTREQEADRMIVHYFDRRVREKAADLRGQYSPERFAQEADTIRTLLRATYLTPSTLWDGQSQLIREATIDGLSIDIRCLKVLPGVYSTLWIYRPQGNSNERHPAVLYLPGHGDPAWDAGVQKRLLGFAKQGYVAMTADPFGQGELTDTPLWNEYHGCQAMAYLLTAGQSLLGIIMASHEAELSYLTSRSDVNPEQVVVMGGSMGGTHALWLSAVDERIKGVAAISAAPVLDASWNLRMHCLCDSMVGAYRVADGEVVRGLVSPRPLLVIYPDLEAPLTEEGAMLINEGKLDFMDKAAKAKYFLSDGQMSNLYPFAREVYDQENASERFKEVVVVGPHGDAQQYRELAYEWFAHFLLGRDRSAPLTEASLSPIADSSRARAVIMAWPDGRRPDDFLGPTAYAQRAISARIATLPKPPNSLDSARRMGAELKQSVCRLLGVSHLRHEVRFAKDGDLEVDGAMAAKYAVEPEPGVLVPMLTFKPAREGKRNGSLYVLLAPQGMMATAASPDRKQLTDDGSWVVCADLRGMGSTYSTQGAYAGLRDQPLCVGALKLGETVAGWWTIDLLAVVEAALQIVGSPVKVTVRGGRETGLVAILAAGQSQRIDAIEAEQLLASYYSAAGYGFPYVYGDAGGHNTDLGVYGSMVPCIPNILEVGDIPQMASMVCPRPLTITDPLWANGKAVSAEDMSNAFAWAKRFYEVSGCPSALILQSQRQDK